MDDLDREALGDPEEGWFGEPEGEIPGEYECACSLCVCMGEVEYPGDVCSDCWTGGHQG